MGLINPDNWKLVKRYLSLRSNSITERTKQAFEDDLRVFCRFLREKHIKDVTHQDIDAFLEYCRDERNNGDAALARKYNTLNKFYKTMIMKDYLDMKNPLDKVEKIKVRQKIRDHVRLDEYKQIMEYLKDKNDIKGLALFSLLYSSGLRVSEIHRLNRNDLDFENLDIVVLGKGQEDKPAMFSEEARDYILQYLDTRQDSFPWLFNSRENNRWSVSAIQKYVKTVAQRAGVKRNVCPHKLRHGIAMLLLEKGVPLNEIQEFLHHKSIQTTQVYARTSLMRVKKNVKNVYNEVL